MIIRNLIWAFFACFIISDCFSQKEHNVSSFIECQYIRTIYDKTVSNNPWGIGLGIQTCLNNNALIQPVIEISALTFLEDDKVLILDANGLEESRINNMISLFAGANIHHNQLVNISFLTGPALIHSRIYLGIKPSVGFYISKKQKTIATISYINVFNRFKNPNSDFGSISFSLGIKLF